MTSIIRAIIVDDEQKSRETLSIILTKYCADVEVIAMAASVEQAYHLLLKQKPDVLFLDIEMPHATGFELLKRLPVIDFEVVFVTGFDHYAIKAIKFHALDYVLKPIDIDELIQAVEKVKKVRQEEIDTEKVKRLLDEMEEAKQKPQQVMIPIAEGQELVPFGDIVRCEADGIYTWFHLTNKQKIVSSKNLGYYEKILPDGQSQSKHRFFRVHHKHLINLSFIKRLNRRENFVEMSDASKVDIAQRRKAEFVLLFKNSDLIP